MAEQPLKIDIIIRPPIDTVIPVDLQDYSGRELYKALRLSQFAVHGEVVKRTPHAFGLLRTSIMPDTPVIDGSSITGMVSTPVPYAQPVEYGSKPHWAPIGPLMLWAQRKHGDYRIAFIAQKAIAKRGTKAHKMFQDGLEAAREYVDRIFEIALEKIEKRWKSGS